MQYRKALIGAVATASLLGTMGVAHANHLPDGQYSPCRTGMDDFHLGYEDTPDRSDPHHDLPTIYANGSPDEGSTEGSVGVCGGSGDSAQFIEIGNNADGPYLANSDPTSALAPN